MNDVSNLVEWGFKALLGGVVTLGVAHLKTISGTMSKVNMQLAALFEKMNWHKEKLDNHETRIVKLEDHKNARR